MATTYLFSMTMIIFMVIMSIVFDMANCSKPMEPILSTIAGSNSIGDGLLATDASLNNPYAVKFLPNNEVLIAEYGNCRIRKVLSNGKITTFAGSNGCNYLAENYIGQCTHIETNPSDSSEVYIACHSQIFKIKNGILTTIAGTAENAQSFGVDGSVAARTALASPKGIAFHPLNGDLYFIESGFNIIRRISAQDGRLYTVAGIPGQGGFNGDGLANSTKLQETYNLAFNSVGELFITDNHRLRKIFLNNGTITTIVSYGGGNQLIRGLSLKSDNEIVFTDTLTYSIKILKSNGTIEIVAGAGNQKFSGDGGRAIDANTYYPRDVTVSPLGELYFSDNYDRIRKISLDGIITTVFGGGNGVLGTFKSIAMNSNSRELLIVDETSNSIKKVSSNGIISLVAGKAGGFEEDGEEASQSRVFTPTTIAVNSITRDIYFCERLTTNNRIRKISALDGKLSTIAGSTVNVNQFSEDGTNATDAFLGEVSQLAINSLGEIFISDSSNHRIRKIALNGSIITVAGIGKIGIVDPSYNGDGIATSVGLNNPSGMFITELDEIYFVDIGNNRIRKIFSNGTLITIAGNGQVGKGLDGIPALQSSISLAGGIAVNSKGEVFFTENYRIRKLSNNGILTTVTGGQSSGFSVDGTPALTALVTPYGLLIDSNDTIIFADFNRVRQISVGCAVNYFWNGTECITTCYGINETSATSCSSHGKCTSFNNCNCTGSYFGNQCELFSCYGKMSNSSNVCSKLNGTCISPNNCSCVGGYYGNECEYYNCYGVRSDQQTVCSSKGICGSPNKCQCLSGYMGDQCEQMVLSYSTTISFSSYSLVLLISLIIMIL